MSLRQQSGKVSQNLRRWKPTGITPGGHLPEDAGRKEHFSDQLSLTLISDQPSDERSSRSYTLLPSSTVNASCTSRHQDETVEFDTGLKTSSKPWRHISSKHRGMWLLRNEQMTRRSPIVASRMVATPWSGAGHQAVRSFTSSTWNTAAAEPQRSPTNISNASMNKDSQKLPSIRQRLRRWEAEHAALPASFYDFQDTAQDGAVSNSLTRPLTEESFADETNGESNPEGVQPLFEQSELVDFGSGRTFLLCGDMVELRTSGGRCELAIFIRDLQKQAQFYTMSGKWINQKSQVSTFFVPHFVSASDVEPLLPFLPDADVSDKIQDKLQSFEYALPRNIGAPLVRRMYDFWTEADTAYRKAAFKLDNAHDLVANDSALRYATLSELANELIPSNMKDRTGDYPSTVLYAVHRTLLQDDIGFRAQRLYHRISGQFEISSRSETRVVMQAISAVRVHQEMNIASKNNSSTKREHMMDRFITKCRALIRRSREAREMSNNGMIGSANAASLALSPTDHVLGAFDGADNLFIRFMESWTALRTFSLDSPLNGTGSAILRAVGMYEGQELDQSTAWVFMQEIGVIAPWMDRVAFDTRIPGTGRILQITEKTLTAPVSLSDTMQHLRKDWGDMPVYCVDSPDAVEIDDGISLEPTDNPEECWIHVHVADPAARFQPDSDMGKTAENMISTIYLAHTAIPMLPHALSQKEMSLSQGRRCLTFSAKVNNDGDVLEHKIQPGVVNEVVYTSPETIKQLQGIEYQRSDVYSLKVGRETQEESMGRQMLTTDELSSKHKTDLNRLSSLSLAYSSKRARNGAIGILQPAPSLKVAIDREADMPAGVKPNFATSYHFRRDPFIELRAEKWTPGSSSLKSDPVESLMLLAGSIAAQWCHDRGIPIIYRVHQNHPDRANPMDFYRKHILPLVIAEKPVPLGTTFDYLSLLGPVLPSSTAGPHITIGVPLYTKATSPLRRYSDLVLHWQIEAALLEEHRRGTSLIGNTTDTFLPFRTADIDALTPRLYTREKMLRQSQSASYRAWTIQLLVRAWRFGEAPLPRTFEYIVRSVGEAKLSGELTLLGGLSAVAFPSRHWLKQGLQIGDLLEVEIEDLNAYSRRVHVKIVGRIGTVDVNSDGAV